MNSKTATDLRRASSALALSIVARTERDLGKPLTAKQRMAALKEAAHRGYVNLKHLWNATPRPERGKLRRKLKGLTQRTHSAVRRNMTDELARLS